MVKIGSVMTPVGKKALLLGSGELGKEVAIELQRYGVEVVACDRYPNAPAMHPHYATTHLCPSQDTCHAGHQYAPPWAKTYADPSPQVWPLP